MDFSRRDFLTTAAVGSMAIGLEAQEKGGQAPHDTAKVADLKPPAKPVIITKALGANSLDTAYDMLLDGTDTLDACIHVGQVQEDDPSDDSVGFGGLPNEEGVVELDACCMHGPTRRAGSVGGVRNVKHVAALSRAVMEHTGHVMLVGEGAERFAYAMGFPKENLLTERSRKIWMLWKQFNSNQDWWGPGIADPKWKGPGQAITLENRIKKLEDVAADLGIAPEYRLHAALVVLFPPMGTIHTSAVNAKGEMSGCTTTSGLAWKIPGRLGDSPIIGAGCYTDQDVGSAGATGSGEENIKVAGAHTIVENMRRGMSPQEAGLDALRRIARNHNNDMNRIKYLDMVYYILRKDGAYAGVSLWSGSVERPRRFAVMDGKGKRIEKTVALFQGTSMNWPPIPELTETK
ncbi:MAG TPA: N(4)-(beta-N-acetylglucosaminyl)-L-asparaginase [Terriglobales bacterium]|nr:N(4)-(beta-N-acetylglucosaminyl)-L-asparaginase [Terriglobales bacterium]